MKMNEKQLDETAKKLETIFDLFGWTWAEKSESPTKTEIKKHIEGLFKDLGKYDSVSCGRINLSKEGKKMICVSLDFNNYYIEME